MDNNVLHGIAAKTVACYTQLYIIVSQRTQLYTIMHWYTKMYNNAHNHTHLYITIHVLYANIHHCTYSYAVVYPYQTMYTVIQRLDAPEYVAPLIK